MIGTIAIREKNEIQWDRGQIRVSEKDQVHKKNVLKMIGIIGIREKRGT
jgi:hypothetical protein